ncbi:MAG: toxin ParE1/3/4 [Cyclobacteriaceae bacterium]|jgi:plasmid stabilization system protein ParE
MAKLNWNPQAKDDLIGIAEYIAQDSKKYARIQIQRLRDRTRQLSKFSESGRVVPELEDPDVREVV